MSYHFLEGQDYTVSSAAPISSLCVVCNEYAIVGLLNGYIGVHRIARDSGHHSITVRAYKNNSQVKLVRAHSSKPNFLTCDDQQTITTWLLKNGYPMRIQHLLVQSSVADLQYNHLGTCAAVGLNKGLVLRVDTNAAMPFVYEMRAIANVMQFVDRQEDSDSEEEPEGRTMITCIHWAPGCHVILVGASNGQIFEMTAEGEVLTVTECTPTSILGLSWLHSEEKSEPIAILVGGGKCLMMASWSECKAATLSLGVRNGCVRWSPAHSLLAVSGCNLTQSAVIVRLLSRSGAALAMKELPIKTTSTEVVWVGEDMLYVVCHSSSTIVPLTLVKGVPSLQLLCLSDMASSSASSAWACESVRKPSRFANLLRGYRNCQLQTTALGREADGKMLDVLLQRPPPSHTTVHCCVRVETMATQSTLGVRYVFMLEHFGEFIPLLKAMKKQQGCQISSNTYAVKHCNSNKTAGFVKPYTKSRTVSSFAVKSAGNDLQGTVKVTQRYPLEFREVKAEFDELVLRSATPLYSRSGYYIVDSTGRIMGDGMKYTVMNLSGKKVFQIGRKSDKSFALDFTAPLTPFQTFSTALAILLAR